MKTSFLKILLTLSISLCCLFRIDAQLYNKDSIQTILKTATVEDSVSVYSYLYYQSTNHEADTNVYFAKKAFTLGSKAKLLTTESYLITNYLRALHKKGNTSEIIQLLDSLELTTQLPTDLPFRAESLQLKGRAYKELGKYKEGLQDLIEAVELYNELGESKSVGNIYYWIGELMREQRQYPEALKYFQKSEKVYENLGAERAQLKVKNGIAIILMENEEPDSGLVILNQVFAALDPVKDSVFMGITYQNMGLAHMNAGRYDSAINYLYKSEAIKKAQNNMMGLLFTNNSIADIHYKQGNEKLGLPYLYKNLDILAEIDQLHQLRNTVWKLATIYEHLERYDSAYFYMKKTKIYSDSLLNESNFQDRLRLIGSYDAKLKEHENILLRTEIESKEQWIMYVTIFSILVITALLLIYLFYRQKNRLSQKLQIQNNELKVLNDEINNLVGIIAHDLKAPLSKIEGLTTLLGMEGALNTNQKDLIEKIKTVNENGKNLIKNLVEVNEIEYSQHKIVASSTIDLSKVLKEVAESYHTKAAEKDITINLTLKKNIERILHVEYLKRILDNLLSNALKFSERKKSITLVLEERRGIPVIEIKDEGPGISKEDQANLFKKFQRLSAQPTAGEDSVGLGLSIVKSLADNLGIEINVKSKLGKGTSFYLIFR